MKVERKLTANGKLIYTVQLIQEMFLLENIPMYGMQSHMYCVRTCLDTCIKSVYALYGYMHTCRHMHTHTWMLMSQMHTI